MNARSAVRVIADRACVAARDTAALRLTLRPMHGAPLAFRCRCVRWRRLAQYAAIAQKADAAKRGEYAPTMANGSDDTSHTHRVRACRRNADNGGATSATAPGSNPRGDQETRAVAPGAAVDLGQGLALGGFQHRPEQALET
ncbi:hypothetical protein KHF85_05400 [Xanthomonas translucens pv. graminis]|uniref:hypothetical protein n=1 Tax=Xanthomonas graminis TaxID=3390026 RepID=UPI0025421267|nr:hypothetical protein [Xanthomonas translucens]WIH05898.1 hypothetical protein KHF85_05400 [Xanthomonas translucens pv. graminis]